MTFEEVLSKLEDVQGFGSRRKAKCPAHPDDIASLSVRETDEGKILLKCHAGCPTVHITRVLGVAFEDLAGDRGVGAKEVRRSEYRDADGKLAYTKVRYEPKDFRFEPAGYRGPRYPYRLPELLAAKPTRKIVWVEGEKDADRLASLGFVATTAGGAQDWRAELARYFAGRSVVIVPDNDAPGRKHAQQVAEGLIKVAKEVSIATLPGLAPKEDVSDFLDRNLNDLDALKRALDLATPFNAMRPSGETLDQIASEDVDFLWFPRIPAVGLTIVFGEAGLGKSTIAIDLLSRITRGDVMPMGTQRFEPKRVVALGFEDDIASVVVGRFAAAKAVGASVLIERPSKYPDPAEPLIPGQIDWLKSEVRKHRAQVVFIDNIENVMIGVGDSNNSLSVRGALAPLVEFAQDMRVAVIALHHPKKGYIHGSAKEGITGSQAYTNVARSTLAAIPVPGQEDLFALAPVKNNAYPRRIPTLTYRLSESVLGVRDGHEVYAPATVQWGRETDATADELFREHARREREKAKSDRAAATAGEASVFLRELDWSFGRTWADIVQLGGERGYSERSLQLARVGLIEWDATTNLWRRIENLDFDPYKESNSSSSSSSSNSNSSSSSSSTTATATSTPVAVATGGILKGGDETLHEHIFGGAEEPTTAPVSETSPVSIGDGWVEEQRRKFGYDKTHPLTAPPGEVP